VNVGSLLDEAIAAHGGMERWREIQSIKLNVSISGYLWEVKGSPEGLSNVQVEIDARQPAVSIAPYRSGVGHFKPDRAWIEGDNGEIREALDDPRTTFDGLLATKWTPLQELYFSGYALWNYLCTPFLFKEPGVVCAEAGLHQENCETWRKLRVTFPPNFPAHCTEQTFYFNDRGFLQRQDYVTEILGGTAAHYSYDRKTVGGIVFPTLRRVVARRGDSAMLSGPTGVLLLISNIVVG
jgi:hypothetical protein